MANIRIGLGTEFNLKNSNLGINTTTPQQRLDVAGVAKAKDLKVTGVSSFTAYQGFLRSDNHIDESIDLEFGNGINASLSGEIIVGTGVTVTLGLVGVGTTGVGIGTTTALKTTSLDTTDVNTAGGSEIECLKVYNTFTPPNGGINERPYAPKPGELYYNFDFKTIEFYDGYGWRQVDNTTRSGRAVTGSGFINPGYTDVTDYVNIATKGNALSFGTLTGHNYNYGACSSSIRGVFGGGGNQPGSAVTDVISYITIASEGDSIDFGNLTTSGTGRTYCRACSSSTRGLFAGGYDPVSQDVIDYVEIGTLGNAIDFGNLTSAKTMVMGCSSPTRAIFAGGGPTYTSTIDTVQIASEGTNAVDFGDLTQARGGGGGCSSQTRGIFIGGEMSDGSTVRVKTIDYITIASFGNAIDFGESTVQWGYMGATSNSTRGLGIGGIPMTNVIDYIQISTAGDAVDFGDLILPRYGVQSLSDSHGGLGGF